MHRPRIGFMSFLFSAVIATVPFGEKIFAGQEFSRAEAFMAAAGALMVLSGVYRQASAAATDRFLQDKSVTMDSRLQRVEAKLSNVEASIRDDLALLYLGDSILSDDSEAAAAWRRTCKKLDLTAYDRYCASYPESSYRALAIKHREDIEIWNNVDGSDPGDIYYFLLTSPFHALRIHAEQKLDESISKKHQFRHAEFWEHVAWPFLGILFPAYFVLSISLIFVVPVILYGLTGTPIIGPSLDGAVEFCQQTLTDMKPRVFDFAQPGIVVLLNNIVTILRLLLAGTAGLLLLFIGVGVVKFVWEMWLHPHVKAVEEQLELAIQSTLDHYR
jgi:hypothetical protein